MTKGKEHLEAIQDSVDGRLAPAHSMRVYYSIASVPSSLTQYEPLVTYAVPGPPSQTPSCEARAMEAQNHSLFKDLFPGLAFSLGLGSEAMPTEQQAQATCFYTVHIA